jgi:hypothetical protein
MDQLKGGSLLELLKKNPGLAGILFSNCGCIVIALMMIAIIAVGFFGITNDVSFGNTPGLNTGDKRTDITPSEWEQIFRAAEAKIGTPWELSAAIVYNETGGGRNFGNCSYFPPAPSGGHVLTSNNGLRSVEDKSAFERIVEAIGYPKNEPVSCNPEGSNGGAMGYMQVMPREWESYSRKIIDAGVVTGMQNPWNAQQAAYVAAMIIKCKAGGSYCSIEAVFDETETVIKKAAGNYYGGGPSSDYAARAYARYLEYKAAGHITE